MDQFIAMQAILDQYGGLTFAGIGVAALGWSPGQIVVKGFALFTVQSFSVVVAHTVTMNLKDKDR